MLIMREETFGPVVPVMAVRDADEAMRLANDSRYGLNASVWTRDVERGIALAQRIESGNACVNECLVSAGIPGLPFGGVKQSGVGTRHGGAEGLRQFCVRQAILVERATAQDRAGVVPLLGATRPDARAADGSALRLALAGSRRRAVWARRSIATVRCSPVCCASRPASSTEPSRCSTSRRRVR